MPIPSNWRQVRLGEVTVLTSMWSPKRNSRSAIQYVDVSAVSREELRIVAKAEYSTNNAPSRARKIIRFEDTIFATVRPTLRRIAQVPRHLDGEIASTAFCVLRANPTAIHPDFLFFATQLDSVIESIAALETGASYPAVRDSDILHQQIPLPPLSEQRDIASVLKIIRLGILQEGSCVSAATTCKRAAMRELFTRGLRGEAQKETEIGPVPESWELASFGALFDIVQGLSLKRNLSDDEEGVLFLRTSNVYWGRIELNTISRMRTTSDLIGDRTLRRGDLLVCEGGEIGRAAVWDAEIADCTFQNHLHRLRPRHSACVVPKFAMSWIEEGFRYRSVYEGAENRTTIPNLSRTRLAELQMPVPTLEEQREIVAILDAIDRKIDLHRRKRAVLNELFKALLHKLMTGEIRIADLDLSAISTHLAETQPKSTYEVQT